MSYNIQEAFNVEGYFSIKVSHLGANLCFLVELEVVEMEYIINEVSEWLGQWFKEVRKWNRDVVNRFLLW